MIRRGRAKRRILRIALVTALLSTIVVAVYYFNVKAFAPDLMEEKGYVATVKQISPNAYKSDNGSWLFKSDQNIWDMYLTGKPYELGCNFGALTEELSKQKEAAFIGEIENRIPSKRYLGFLKYFVGWFNRDIDEYIPPNYKAEIYGSSAYLADDFDFISSKYQRALNYHAAHDIGHALQNMNLVGCTSFAVKDSIVLNGKLMIGRNFDFYFGSEFAEDQIIAFYRPHSGYQFMSVTWAGFSGVVSGMNEKGLSVTLNSAKSGIPSKGTTPVSIIARDILQYAANIDEAYTIAQRHLSFVSETFLIGSAADKCAALIEKTPDRTAILHQSLEPLIATNHLQTDLLAETNLNMEYMSEGVSSYRQERVQELIDSLKPLDEKKIAAILRNQKGLKGDNIGMGNEKAINQLIAHHSVIFSPEDRIVWVSTPPYMLGEYRAYDLTKIFDEQTPFSSPVDTARFISTDQFLNTESYNDYVYFLSTREKIQTFLFSGRGKPLTNMEIEKFQYSNPNSFLTFYYLGEYYLKRKEFARAKEAFERGLLLMVARDSERRQMQNGIEIANSKLD